MAISEERAAAERECEQLKAQLAALQSQLKLERREKGELLNRLSAIGHAKRRVVQATGEADQVESWCEFAERMRGVARDYFPVSALTPQEAPNGR
jgi:predicted RNase H-like nuclease (RuvC/YqgF family)